MKRQKHHYSADLAVIGTGLAGMAASIFAMDRGVETVLIGNTGAIAYTTGYFDLFGVSKGQIIENPWKAVAELRSSRPDHPLSRIPVEDIRTAFSRFTEALSGMGIGYTQPGESNLMALLPAGLVKPTLSVPNTMAPGITAHQANARTVIADITGLQGFSAQEMAANLRAFWPRLTHGTLGFPDMDDGAPVYLEVMARALEVPAIREQFAGRMKGQFADIEYIGLPAMLGVHLPDVVHADLERRTGARIFEIPTMPPAIAGIRLREMFENTLSDRGVTLVAQRKVERAEFEAERVLLHVSSPMEDIVIEARAAILATGRFLSGGLAADRDKVREPLLGLPVNQPEDRRNWYRQDYFDPGGHPVNRAGIEVDAQFCPLDANGKRFSDRLFAAGTVLAHQDWVRQRCGAGVAIASASKAVASVANLLG